MARAAQRYRLAMPVAIAGDGEMLAPLGVRGVPATVFIDEHGVIVAAVTGGRERAYLRRRARELLDGI